MTYVSKGDYDNPMRERDFESPLTTSKKPGTESIKKKTLDRGRMVVDSLHKDLRGKTTKKIYNSYFSETTHIDKENLNSHKARKISYDFL